MRRARAQAPTETIKGELLHFTVRGDDYWGTGIVRTKHDGGDVTIAGKVLGAKSGDTVELHGTWSDHPKYGRQFKVTSCEVLLPSDASGVVGWLAQNLPQVSRRRAEELVERHGVEGVWRLLDESDADALMSVDGITAERARAIFEAYNAHKGSRDKMVRLKSWGLTDAQISRVLKEWGSDAERRLKENPYELAEVVDGFGWTRADQVARRMGVAIDAQPRLSAGIMHTLREAVAMGNCYVSSGKLVAIVASKVCGVDEAPVWRALDALVESAKLVKYGERVYLPKLAAAEARLAEVFAARAQAEKGKAA